MTWARSTLSTYLCDSPLTDPLSVLTESLHIAYSFYPNYFPLDLLKPESFLSSYFSSNIPFPGKYCLSTHFEVTAIPTLSHLTHFKLSCLFISLLSFLSPHYSQFHEINNLIIFVDFYVSLYFMAYSKCPIHTWLLCGIVTAQLTLYMGLLVFGQDLYKGYKIAFIKGDNGRKNVFQKNCNSLENES